MSTQRYISTSFWTDKWIRSLDPSERYLYMYLLTNPQTNIAGVYQITLDRIAFDTGYDERTLRPMIERFKAKGKAHYFAEEWIILPSWPKHQKWQSKKTIKSGIDSIISTVPEGVKKYMVSIGYQYPIIGYGYGPSYLNSDLNSDSDSNSDTDTDSSSESQFSEAVPAEPGRADAPQDKDQLYQAIWQSFLAKTPKFTNYPKEAQATKRLVRMFRDLDPDNSESAAEQTLSKFWQLTHQGSQFWQKQPFTPSTLSSTGIFDRVRQEMTSQDLSADWVDQYIGGGS